MNRTAALWLAVGWVGFAIIPWYAIYDGFWSLEWLDGYPTDIDSAPAVLQVLMHGRWWLAPIGLALLAPVAVLWRPKTDRRFATTLRAAGALGLAIALAQGFAIGLGGWEFEVLANRFGELGDRQFGMGYGALLVFGAFLFLLTQSAAARGAIKGDVFVVGSIGLVIALVAAFIFWPVARILVSAFLDNDDNLAPALFFEKLFSRNIWGLDCLTVNLGCGVAWTRSSWRSRSAPAPPRWASPSR